MKAHPHPLLDAVIEPFPPPSPMTRELMEDLPPELLAFAEALVELVVMDLRGRRLLQAERETEDDGMRAA